MSSLLSMTAGVVASGYRPFTFDINQATRSGICNSGEIGGSCTATSNTATTTVSGGKAPFTYLWTFVSGDSFTITSPTSSSTTFSKTNAAPNVLVGVYKCTITDDNNDSLEDTVIVTLTFNDLS